MPADTTLAGSRIMREMLKEAADDLRSVELPRRGGRANVSITAAGQSSGLWMKEGHKALPTRTSSSHPITG